MLAKICAFALSLFSRKNTSAITLTQAAEPIDIPSDVAQALAGISGDPESLTYMLRMFWQARFAKLSEDYPPSLDWLTRTFLPPDLVANSYHYPTHYGPACFEGMDHYELARTVVKGALACPEVASKISR